jgi:hypothetical protein
MASMTASGWSRCYVRSMPHSELARLTQIDYDRGNESMLSLAKAYGGFKVEETDEPGIVRIRLALRPGAA